MEESQDWNPVILVAQESIAAFTIFNPNDWSQASKGIVASCAAQFALLNYANSALSKAQEGAAPICNERLAELQRQWRRSQWDLSRGRYFVEIPAVHLSIQSFLVTVKTLLDLLSQLLSTERIVHTKLHGFHKKGSVVGGEVLHALAKKRNPQQATAAENIRQQIIQSKAVWIDDAVVARDYLAHPVRGAPQVMWELEVRASDGGITCDRIVPPHVGDYPFDHYAKEILAAVDAFATGYLDNIRRSSQHLNSL